jgi:hypothetical protein
LLIFIEGSSPPRESPREHNPRAAPVQRRQWMPGNCGAAVVGGSGSQKWLDSGVFVQSAFTNKWEL